MAGKYSVEGVFKATDRMTRPIAKMESRMETMRRKMEMGVRGFAQRAGNMWQSASKGAAALDKKLDVVRGGIAAVSGAAVVAGAAVGAGLVSVMRTGMDFEKTLLSAGNKFEAGISKTSESYAKLSAAAQDVGGKTEFSASQAAGALKELAGAGFTVDQAIKALPGTVDLATAAEMDLAAATEIAVKSLGAFGLKSKDPAELAKNLTRVSDVMARTDDLSSTSIEAIFEAMQEGGAVAKTAGASIETYSALVAGLADLEQGSKAGTTLKNMFLTLSAPTDEAAAAFARFGIKTKDARGNTRDAIEVLGELSKATAKLGTGDKAGVLEAIFGKIPIAGVTHLLDQVPQLEANRTAIQDSGGSVQKKATSLRSGGTGAWDNLTSGMEALSLAIFEVVGGPMTELINSTTEWIGKVKDGAIPYVQELVAGLREGFQQVWPHLKGALDILVKAFGDNPQFLQTVKTLAQHLGRVAAIAVTVGAVIGGMLVGALQLSAAWIRTLTGAFQTTIATMGQVIFAIDDFFANVGAKWRAFSFKEWGLQIVRGIAQGIKDGASFVYEAITGLGDAMVAKLKGVLDIHSPSKRTAELGRFAAMGVGEGWEAQLPAVNKSIEQSLNVSPLLAPAIPAINAMSLGSDRTPSLATPSLGSSEERLAGALDTGLGTGEVVIRDESGRAEVTEQPKRTKLTLEPARSGLDKRA